MLVVLILITLVAISLVAVTLKLDRQASPRRTAVDIKQIRDARRGRHPGGRSGM